MIIQQPNLFFRTIYDLFDAPVTDMDCGEECAKHHPAGIPFCCDICHAVPVAYRSEWQYLQTHSSLWHEWRGDECPEDETDPLELRAQTPDHLCLLACQGVSACQRNYRAVSCRQFPFVPYLTADFRFIGMTYDWSFTSSCWVISHLDRVLPAYREGFFTAFDHLFETWLEDMESYIDLSEEIREHYQQLHQRIPLLHRDGRDYWISPKSGRLTLCSASQFPRFSPYQEK